MVTECRLRLNSALYCRRTDNNKTCAQFCSAGIVIHGDERDLADLSVGGYAALCSVALDQIWLHLLHACKVVCSRWREGVLKTYQM